MSDTSTMDLKLIKKSRRRSSTADRRLRIAGCVIVAILLLGPSLTASAVEHDDVGALSDVNESLPVRVRRHCPSCQLSATAAVQNRHQQMQQQHQKSVVAHPVAGESARLESIKRQILIKLGLSAKPQLPADAVPPREVIMETLLRAEESAAGLDRTTPASPTPGRRSHQQQQHHQHPASDADSNAVEDDFYGKTSEIIAFAEPGPKLNGQTLAEFSRVQETAPEPSLRVKSATLWLYVKIRKQSSTSPARETGKRPPTLYIFRVINGRHEPHSNASMNQNWSELVASERITLQHSGWTKVNMTDGVRKWFSSGSATGGTTQRLRLLIDCSGCGTHVEPVLFDGPYGDAEPATSSGKRRRKRRRRRRRLTQSDDYDEMPLADGPSAKRKKHGSGGKKSHNKHRPFLVVHTDSSASRRLRRRTPLDCSPTTSACCKQRFFVSFRALGWDDWIIAPSGYYANYCRGDCGGGPAGRTPDTFINYHSHVIDELRKLPSTGRHRAEQQGNSNSSNNSTSVTQPSFNQDDHQQLLASLQPCCAPTKFSSMSLIYFGPDMNIIKRDLPKMVVDECGCP